MSLSLLEKFDQIMNNLEKDIELTLLKEKMEHMKERRRVAVRKYMKKLRETDEFKEKERLRAKKGMKNIERKYWRNKSSLQKTHKRIKYTMQN